MSEPKLKKVTGCRRWLLILIGSGFLERQVKTKKNKKTKKQRKRNESKQADSLWVGFEGDQCGDGRAD
jgi:hypothetical protein